MWRISHIFILVNLFFCGTARLYETLISPRITSREASICESRQTPGLICESCDLLATCVRIGEKWTNIPVESCNTDAGEYCNAKLGKCSNVTGPCHPFATEGNFPCPSAGIFPDPFDCQKYHMCYIVSQTLVAASLECPGNKAYNAATGQCTLTIDSAICKERQIECKNAGDAGAWPGDPNIFYICKASSNQDVRVLYPTLYRCEEGKIFNGYMCTHTGVPPIIPTSGPEYPWIVNPVPTGSPIQPTECNQRGLMADPDNCHKYFYCASVNGNRRHIDCPAGTFYNNLTAACTLGSC